MPVVAYANFSVSIFYRACEADVVLWPLLLGCSNEQDVQNL